MITIIIKKSQNDLKALLIPLRNNSRLGQTQKLERITKNDKITDEKVCKEF